MTGYNTSTGIYSYTTTPFWYNYTAVERRTSSQTVTIKPPDSSLCPSILYAYPDPSEEDWDGLYTITEVRIYAPGYIIH